MVRRSIGGTCLQSDARHGAELCVANSTPPCEARQSKTERGVASTTAQRTSVGVHKDESFHGATEDGEWSLRLWRDAVMVSNGHWRGTLARVRRCRPIWRRPENQRWDRKPLTEMDGEPWNTSPRQKEKLQIKDRECIALKHMIKCGGQKGSMTCCEDAESNLWDLRARTQDIVDNEVVQTDSQRKFERLTRKDTAQFEQGTMQSSTGCTAMSAGRPSPEGQPHDDVGCSC